MLVIQRVGNRQGEVIDVNPAVGLLGIERGTMSRLEGEELLRVLEARDNGDDLPTFPAESRPKMVSSAETLKLAGRRGRRRKP